MDTHKQNIEAAAGDRNKTRASRNMVTFIRGAIIILLSIFILCLQLRLFESEVAIEDIIRERTNTAFRNKCSEYL